MANWNDILMKTAFLWFIVSCVSSEDISSSSNGDSGSSSTNSDRYGKRPSGHSFVRFGKRDEPNRGHSFLYFGKRTIPDDSHIAQLLKYLQRNQEPSWKRGHSIMRFGKRTSANHNILRFGKRDESEEDFNSASPDDIKRAGHSMMYFGKRGGHSMMYFGKRNPEEDEKRAGHSMMYFGKREAPMYSQEETDKRAGHSMLYFGKRGGHSMMYFGKRDQSEEEYPDEVQEDKRYPHSMIHFGKKSDGQKSHNMLRFGKREEDFDGATLDDLEQKRAGHNMIHFGKREAGLSGDDYPMWMHSSGPFEPLRGSYYPMGFNSPKRGPKLDKKPHNMMHFGKRSVDENPKTVQDSRDDETKQSPSKESSDKNSLSRRKRDLSSPDMIGFAPFVPSYSYDYVEDEAESPETYDESKLVPARKVRSVSDQEKSKNAFMRFG